MKLFMVLVVLMEVKRRFARPTIILKTALALWAGVTTDTIVPHICLT
ncbi:hypothetical protein HBZS_112270 [Helicobacter bizzozeronii CCUG 35545]|nr:hypothetical protein HBZS_112270 [Helicobacter bizzozeronii CCUG 35545]